MSGVYTVQFNGVAVTAAQDLFELVAASGKPIVILGFSLSQSTEVGDTAEEALSILLKSGQSTSGSGGSTPTPVANDSTMAAAGFTAEANNTTKASTGTIVTHGAWAWNIRVPLDVLFTQEQQLVMAASRRCTLELATTPADSITLNGVIWVQELG
jgi:hypothetical protein